MYSRKDKFEPGKHFHIYNKAVGKEKLFKNDNNYKFFLLKFGQYISPIADLLSYCLLPNHFHFLVLLKEAKDINISDYSRGVSRSFSNLFNCYAQAYNKQENRQGSLFKNRFKHIDITDHDYLVRVIQYIHTNPVHHRYCNDFMDWKYSSYKAILSDKATKINRRLVIEYFDDINNFIYCHQLKQHILNSENLFE